MVALRPRAMVRAITCRRVLRLPAERDIYAVFNHRDRLALQTLNENRIDYTGRAWQPQWQSKYRVALGASVTRRWSPRCRIDTMGRHRG